MFKGTDSIEDIRSRAADTLAGLQDRNPQDCLQEYLEFYNSEEERLYDLHANGAGGREYCVRRAHLIDIFLTAIYEHARSHCGLGDDAGARRLALAAVGGYGRGELNPYSDIDIMFLHDAGNQISAAVNATIERVLYTLWDMGFKVGHSTRTAASAAQHASEDYLSLTALLEARRICGDGTLFEEFYTLFQRKCIDGKEAQYVEWRVKNQRERHVKFGDTVFVQEPNIKNGVGGLRDYQNLSWITYFKEGVRHYEQLVDRQILLQEECALLESAYDFLLRTRTELHLQHGRVTDQLTIYYQGQIANKFDYPQQNIIHRSEEFMRDYYRHARDINRITNTVANRLALTLREERDQGGKFFGILGSGSQETELMDGFVVRDGRIYRGDRNMFDEDPLRILRVFLHAQQRRLSLSPQLMQFITRRKEVVDRTIQYSKSAREIFQALLSKKGEVGRILRMMHETEVLGAYIPEFGALDCLVQHEFYHRYTADEHTLRVVEMLDKLIDTEDQKLSGYRRLFEKLQDPFVLYLAILLHDTGRATDSRHHAEESTIFAQQVAKRLQLSPERRKELIVLVDNHTQLSLTSQRRNLDDPATIEEFATIIRSKRYLDALMLLTYADGMGTTGESTWSDWKEALVWRLYRSTKGYFEEGKRYFEDLAPEKSEMFLQVARQLDGSFDEELHAHFDSMPAIYFNNFSTAEITDHLRLFREFLELLNSNDELSPLLPAMRWIPHQESGHTEVLFCTWDRKALLERIAASFAIAGINILSADIYTRDDNLVLDVFRVCDTDFGAVTHSSDINQVEEALKSSLQDPQYDFNCVLEKKRDETGYHLSREIQFPTRITISNDAHPTFTVVDIQTPDRLGLLHDILGGFTKAGVNIVLSRISTEKGGVLDSFYITSQDGGKLTSDSEIQGLQEALREAAPL